MLENMLENFMFQTNTIKSRIWTTVENEDAIYLQLEVPGYTIDNISVFDNNTDITVEGKNHSFQEISLNNNTRVYNRFEEQYNFKKVFAKDKKYEVVSAELKDGLLTITLNKKEGQVSNLIQIKSG